ncbi:MAG: integrase family protein [Rhodocyclaceae bacterium]|nr:integrase family protein [Rhodocyclaceae bacterium]
MPIKLTKAAIEGLPLPDGRESIVRDSELKGFAVRVTSSGHKSYIVEKKVAGKTRRITLARCDLIPLREAREVAISHLAEMARGITPQARQQSPDTLSAVLEQYIAERQARHPPMKPKTADSYRKLMAEFGDHMGRSVASIGEREILDLHAALTKRGPTHANNVMRVARAIFNYAEDLELAPANPIAVMRRRRLWNRERRRTRRLDAETLPLWWKMLEEMDVLAWPARGDVIRDLWRFMLLTGMRYEEAGRLRIENVDLKRATFTVLDTKNRDDVTLPAGRYVLALLTRRCALGGEWVFPAPKRTYTSAGHDIRKTLIVATGLDWSPHDLRRTFASVIESFDVSDSTIKRLLGHKVKDVTGGYIQQDMERLRGLVQRYEDCALAGADSR